MKDTDMSPDVLAYQIKQLEKELARQELEWQRRYAELEAEFKTFVDQQHKREKDQLKWGVGVLTTTAGILAMTIFHYLTSKIGIK